MSKSIRCLLWLVPAIHLALPAAVQAQTANTPPPGAVLLPAALVATALRGSEHLSGTLGLGSTGGVPLIVADVDGNGAIVGQPRTALRLKPIGAGAALLGAAPISLAIKGNDLATRTGKGKWSCTKLGALLSGQATGLKLPIPGLALPTLLSLPTLQAPVDLGSDSIDGLGVWHLQIKSTASSATPTAIDLYVNQSNFSIARAVISTGLTGQAALGLVLTLNFSQYGKTVKVRLPSVCTAKVAGKHTS